MRARLALLVVLVALAPACRRKVSFDRDSPDATLTSFFAALSAGQLPDHLDDLLSTDAELSSWRLRCAASGCQGGWFRVVGRGERSSYQAILYVDYLVRGEGHARIMGGTHSPIRFERDSRGWLIAQFGELIAPPDAPVVSAPDAAPTP